MAVRDYRSMAGVGRGGAAFGQLLVGIVALCSLIGTTAYGQTQYYYDNNGATAGFGNAGNTWGTSSVISTSSAGTASPANTLTTTADTLNLGTDALGLGAGTISVVGGGRSIGSIVRGAASSPGIMTIQGGAIDFAATGSVINNAAGQTLTISSTITGGGTSMTFTNANIIGTNSYGGATILSGAADNRINSIANGGTNSPLGSSSSDASNLVFEDGASLRYDGGTGTTNRNFTINGSSAKIYARGTGGTNLTWNGTAAFGTANQAATLNLQSNVGDGIFNGLLADNGSGQLSLVKSLSTSWTLNAANTFTGSTTISGGILVAGNANALQNSYIDTAASATGTATTGLRTTGAALNLGGLSGDKNLSDIYTTSTGGYGSVTGITLNVASANNVSYSGAITGGRSLTKSGNGIQALSGTNTYTGTTSISAGTILLDGTHTGGGTYTIASGATLGGSGSTASALNVSGILAPGNSIGTLDTGTVTWNGAPSAGSATDWVFELGPGDTADLLNITGDFSLNTGTGSSFRFDFAGSTDQGIFDLVTWTGSTNVVSPNSEFSYTNLGPGNSGSFQVTGSTLQFVVVPEPATLTLLACSGVMAALALRRRLRRA